MALSPKKQKTEFSSFDSNSANNNANDSRVQVSPTTSPPYKWICSLTIQSATGNVYLASGFKIRIPDTERAAVVTSGHCIYLDGSYAKIITVEFPGEDIVEVQSNDLYASREYIATEDDNYDYGLILLPGNCNDGFGWSTILKDSELHNRLVTNCGFPGDKPQGTMWITGGEIASYTSTKIYFMNDTCGAQSGSPIYTWYNGYWTVIGIHIKGICPNIAVRFTINMISTCVKQIQRTKTIQSLAFPNIYIRCDPKDTSMTNTVGGSVNGQYTPPQQSEKFYIYPVQMPPSLVQESSQLIVIESASAENIFIRMNGSRITKFEAPGGGEVNCKYGAGETEMYYLKEEEEDEGYSFKSKAYPNCYIRIDGRRVDPQSTDGGGVVNCQYYVGNDGPAAWEFFQITAQ